MKKAALLINTEMKNKQDQYLDIGFFVVHLV